MDADLFDVIRAALDAAKGSIFTALPGKITVWDPLTNTAVVQPTVKETLWTANGERVYEAIPEIPFVPVMWPRAGAYALTMPLLPGDSCLLVFSKIATGEFRETGQMSEPQDARVLGPGYPFLIPGFTADIANPLSPEPLDLAARTAGPVFGEHAGLARIEINPVEGIKLGKGAVAPVALAPAVIAWANAVKAAVLPLLGGAGTPAGAAFDAATTAFLAAVPSTKVKAL